VLHSARPQVHEDGGWHWSWKLVYTWIHRGYGVQETEARVRDGQDRTGERTADAALDERVTAIAAALDGPKSWVIEQAVRDFVAMQEWQRAAVEEGIKAADAGRVAAHEDVVAWVKSWGSPDELPMPEGG
jgi:predicted transcriptional regulator